MNTWVQDNIIPIYITLSYKGDYIGPREMRKHATWYTRGITHGAILRDKFNKAEKREDFIDIIEKYLLKPSP